MGDISPQEGKEVGKIRRTEQVMDFRWLFPSFPMKSPAKQDLIILVAFLVTFGLLKRPLGWWMSDTPPNEVEKIRKTWQEIDFRWLSPFLPMERPAKQDLVILMAFGCFGALIEVPWSYDLRIVDFLPRKKNVIWKISGTSQVIDFGWLLPSLIYKCHVIKVF